MRRHRLISYVLLLLAWSAVAVWQWQEYGHERYLARQRLGRQADWGMNLLIGTMRSHRRLGFFFEEQIQGFLDGAVTAEDILAVAVLSEESEVLLSAGETDLLGATPQVVPGQYWDPAGFRLVAQFKLEPPAHGSGAGRGVGPGSGRGRGLRWDAPLHEDPEGPFSSGGQFAAVLLLDRTDADQQCRHAAWSRVSVVAASGLVLICLALAWRATVRAAEAHGRARLLESEARHLRDLGQAAAGLAHETRNPLGLIRGWTQRLGQSGLDSPEHQQQAQAVVEECDRVTARINQFLAFARPSEPKPEPVDVSQVFDELAALLEPDLAGKELTLNRGMLSPGETIRADREMVRQALFNLLQNAVQASPERATVEIALSNGRDGQKRIEVADRGPGVPAEAVKLLFTPYFTLRPNGTGLGLAIVRRIASAHGWEAGYTPRRGGGAVFWLDRIHG